MTGSALSKKVRKYFRTLKDKLKRKTSRRNLQIVGEKPHQVAFRLIGKRSNRFLPLFRDMDVNLERSGLKVDFKAYVSLTVLAVTLTSLTTLLIIPLTLVLFLDIGPPAAILFGIGGSLFATAFSTIGFYVYPIYKADKHKRDLEDELPFAAGYMTILANAGVSPEKIFHSISNLALPLTLSEEAKNIVRDVELFGSDIISALSKASKRTPSDKLREMLEGLISTVHSGGNLGVYLRQKSSQYMKLRRMDLRKFSDTLSVLSEFYVTLLVTGPLLLVIMLAVMLMIGGESLGMLAPDLLLNILTYLAIPLGSIMFLIVLDAVSPRW